jgi:two-component system chemotaxis response regulator CheV
MMMDVEKVLAETTRIDDEIVFKSVQPIDAPEAVVFFADDSIVARRQIEKTLQAMGVRYVAAVNGRQAWEELDRAATYALSTGKPISSVVTMVLTDIEMPEMDGYMLTKQIKSDARFQGVPVIMHSSLSGMSNQALGKSVGVDEYVSKFEPQKLSEAIARRILGESAVVTTA